LVFSNEWKAYAVEEVYAINCFDCKVNSFSVPGRGTDIFQHWHDLGCCTWLRKDSVPARSKQTNKVLMLIFSQHLEENFPAPNIEGS
jgi:hypothetical protein